MVWMIVPYLLSRTGLNKERRVEEEWFCTEHRVIHIDNFKDSLWCVIVWVFVPKKKLSISYAGGRENDELRNISKSWNNYGGVDISENCRIRLHPWVPWSTYVARIEISLNVLKYHWTYGVNDLKINPWYGNIMIDVPQQPP